MVLEHDDMTYSLSEKVFEICNMILSLRLDANVNLQNLNIQCEDCRVNPTTQINLVKTEFDMILSKYINNYFF